MFKSLLAKLATALVNANIPYMVIGGQAVLLYGEPRLTKDIDVTVGVGLEEYQTILHLVEELLLDPLVETEEFTQKTMVLPCQDRKTGIRVDLIFSHSPYERQAMERVQKVTLDGVDVCFAGTEDIVIHKIIAGRPRDLEDVESIIHKNSEMDREYIEDWLKKFSEAIGELFLDRFRQILKK